MNTLTFNYDKSLLSDCKERSINCKDLFARHQEFYLRTRSTQEQFDRFIQAVDFVYRHNLRWGKESSYKVSLNQFSDQLESDLPLYESDYSFSQKHSEAYNFYNHSITILSDVEFVGGFLKAYSRQKTFKTITHTPNQALPVYLANFTDLYHTDFKFDNNNFQTHLDWSTEANPDGIPLVHPPIDQGHCGSCWAFAAIGSVEAIASRRAGYAVYNTIMTHSVNDSVPGSLEQLAVASAQQTALDVHQKTHLSIQELISCDQMNQGCSGGNPLMAFPFIKKFGLLSNAQYPYSGKDKKCYKRRLKKSPVATADKWAVLRSNDEGTMMETIRYIGPVAVGIHGSSQGFLHYSGGIFDGECKTILNHALLLVGYGEELTERGMVKYWIARNSWGSHWGENGFIRIKRSDRFGDEGLCGVARFPSVAIGATLMESLEIDGSNYDFRESKNMVQGILNRTSGELLSTSLDFGRECVYMYSIWSIVIVTAAALVVFILRFIGRRRKVEFQNKLICSYPDYGSIIYSIPIHEKVQR